LGRWLQLVEDYSLLKAKGLHAVAVQNPLSSIVDDVASTNRLINAQDGPVLLVGHSYGGAVITEAGHNPKAVGLVYVAACAPEEGETLGGMAQNFPTPPAYSEIRSIEDGFLLLTEKGVTENFAQDLSPEERALHLRPKERLKAQSCRRPSRRLPGTPSRAGLLSLRMTGPSRPNRK